MVGRASTILDLIKQAVPSVHEAFATVRPTLGTVGEAEAIERLNCGLPSVDFSRWVLSAVSADLAVLLVRDAVLAHLPVDLRAVFEVTYILGWRVKSEILTRHWPHVDFRSGWLRLEPGETKNGEGRQFPLTPDLRAVLERQRERTTAEEKMTGAVIPWASHRAGKPIKSFRRAWVTACKKAGIAERVPHDFRRTAVRNLERAGVPRSTAMKMVGHRTESIYRR